MSTKPLGLILLASSLFWIPQPSVRADFVGAQWSSGTTGTLNGVAVTLAANGGNPLATATTDLSGSDYRFAPLSTSEPILDYSQNANLTATFASPVAGLRLYLAGWRNGTYTFDRPFLIRSGSGFTKAGNQITVPASFANGIIEFTQPVTTLNIVSSAFGSGSFSIQSLQFGVGRGSLRVAINGPRRIRTKRPKERILGTATGPSAIVKVEYRAPGRGFRRVRGTEFWGLIFRPKRRVSPLIFRAVDTISRKSPPARVTVISLRRRR